MSEILNYNFNGIYSLIDLIENNINMEIGFWNYDKQCFIEHSSKFKKKTLLHQYFVVTCLNEYLTDFRKNTDFYEEEEILESWYEKFEQYNIPILKYSHKKNYNAYKWFLKNRDKFENLFDIQSNEAFYILFNNRNFLLKFNQIVSNSVYDLGLNYPKEFTTKKGTIKRINIPIWVKKAVFHRDKGRCVFCNIDLTNLRNILTKTNYDHIVPLDLYGANDPCNIQLTCETCNKSKSNHEAITSNKYFSWW